MLQHKMQLHSAFPVGVPTRSHRRALASFIQSPADYLTLRRRTSNHTRLNRERRHELRYSSTRSHMLRDCGIASAQNAVHGAFSDGVPTHSQRRAVTSFIQSLADYFDACGLCDASPTLKQSYEPQSGNIHDLGDLSEGLADKAVPNEQDYTTTVS